MGGESRRSDTEKSPRESDPVTSDDPCFSSATGNATLNELLSIILFINSSPHTPISVTSSPHSPRILPLASITHTMSAQLNPSDPTQPSQADIFAALASGSFRPKQPPQTVTYSELGSDASSSLVSSSSGSKRNAGRVYCFREGCGSLIILPETGELVETDVPVVSVSVAVRALRALRVSHLI
jgi:hypothetical protein